MTDNEQIRTEYVRQIEKYREAVENIIENAKRELDSLEQLKQGDYMRRYRQGHGIYQDAKRIVAFDEIMPIFNQFTF